MQAGLHVLVAKPLVRTLEHHRQLVAAAEEAGIMVSPLIINGSTAMHYTQTHAYRYPHAAGSEHHKRFNLMHSLPIYTSTNLIHQTPKTCNIPTAGG